MAAWTSAATNADLVEQVRFHESQMPITTVYVNASDLEQIDLAEFFEAVIGGVCSDPHYLVTTGLIQTGDAICAGLTIPGFSGYTLANPGPPPTACRVSQPTLIISSPTQQLDLDEWATHLGCSGGDTRTDSAGNRITEYKACATTLVHVQTESADPWATSMDGLPPADFARLIMDKAQ